MVVCQYFMRGQCRFGDNCRNEHPGNPRGGGGGGFGNQSWSNSAATTGKAAVLPFTQDSIRSDLTSDKPLWPLSTYGPAKCEPNLIAGLDESSEELRVRAVLALKAGNMNEYTIYESNKIQAANQAYDIARNNLTQAHQTASNQSLHSTKPTSAFVSTSTAAPTTTTISAFGQTGFGSTAPSAFGQPSQAPQSVFGQPTQPPQSAFGSLKPAATITTGGSVFGQSSFGQPQQQPQSVFGQTSGPSPSSPSSMIKPASGAFSAFAGNASSSPFAAAAAAAAVNQNQNQNQNQGGGGFSAFAGQPSAFGTSSGSAFGQPSGAAPVSAFGQAQQQPTSAFGGLQTQPTSALGGGGGFGSFGATPTQPQSAFGNLQTTQPVQSAFGQQPQTQPQSVFGGGGAFGGGNANVNPLNPLNAAPTSSVFTPLSNQSNPLNAGGPTQSPFAANPLNPPQPQPTSAFSSANPFTNTTTFPSTTSTTTGPTINPITNPNTRPDFSRIFEMVKGKYKPGVTPYDALLPPNYAGLLPEAVTEAFQGAKFEFGKVPDWVPPVEFR